MTNVPALKITITDDSTGVTYTDSVHRIIGTILDAETGDCSFKVAIYASQEALESGKQPIVFNGFGRPFFIMPFSKEEVSSIFDLPFTEIEKLLTPKQVNTIRARNFLQTLVYPDRCPFDYLGSSTAITATL